MTDATQTTADATPATPATPSWSIDKIEDQGLREFAINKGYNKLSSPEEILPKALDSYRNMEKLFGADRAGRTIEIPDFTKPEQAAAFWNKVGRPETPDKYDLGTKQGEAETDFTKTMREVFHAAGVTGTQASTLAKAFGDFQAKALEAEEQSTIEANQKADLDLKREWGAAYNDKMLQAKNAAKAFGASEAQIDALQKVMGWGDVMKFFANAASKIGEDKFVNGDRAGNTGNVPMSPEEAKVELNRLMKDQEWVKKWLDAKHPEHKAALERKAFLSSMMAGVSA